MTKSLRNTVVVLFLSLLSSTTLSRLTFADELDTSAREKQREKQFAELEGEISTLERQGRLLRKVVKLVRPSVVHIEAQSANRTVSEAGGGVIISLQDRHFVLTNRHVIKDSTLRTIDVLLDDDRKLHPTRVWADRGTDVAVMEMDVEDLVPARIGDSDKVEIGDFVLAVGSPFGLNHSFAFGIISAKERRDLELGGDGVRYQNFIQTDAAINPGNSGGPLIDLRGNVIGINTAIASNSGGNDGIGFTIPINMAINVARQLIVNGRVARAYLGVHLDREFDPAVSASQLGLPRPHGARVSGITPRSPAESAKIRVNDVIMKLNGSWIADDDHLINRVSVMPVGQEVVLSLVRERRIIKLKLKVGDRAKFEPVN